jgi:hypothetical protein
MFNSVCAWSAGNIHLSWILACMMASKPSHFCFFTRTAASVFGFRVQSLIGCRHCSSYIDVPLRLFHHHFGHIISHTFAFMEHGIKTSVALSSSRFRYLIISCLDYDLWNTWSRTSPHQYPVKSHNMHRINRVNLDSYLPTLEIDLLRSLTSSIIHNESYSRCTDRKNNSSAIWEQTYLVILCWYGGFQCTRSPSPLFLSHSTFPSQITALWTTWISRDKNSAKHRINQPWTGW